MQTDLLLAGLALVVGCTGCNESKVPLPPQPIGETHTTSAETVSGPGSPAPSSGGGVSGGELVHVVVTSRVRAPCGMPRESHEPPMFAFDGKKLRPRGEDVLGEVGRCAAATADVQLCVAGYVGPEQTETYEEALARAHADAAAIELEKAGVGRERITVAVRGGEIMTGTGGVVAPPVERRVEIDLRSAVPCTGWQ